MAYWIFENGQPVGPLTALEVIQRARTDTLVSHGRTWVRMDRHPDFGAIDRGSSNPPATSSQPSGSIGPGGRCYWIYLEGRSIGPLDGQAVLQRARPETPVSFNRQWIALHRHPDFAGLSAGPASPSRPGPPVQGSDQIQRAPGVVQAASPRAQGTSPRIRRLMQDFERISTRFRSWPLILVEVIAGRPPDTYRVHYRIKGLYATPDGNLMERNEHVVEIKLGLQYPRRPPQCKLLTPLFHPNFNNSEVCAQDNYAASEGLDDLIVRIGRMVAYQEYNTKSPLNGIAAKWAEEHAASLPVDRREISPPTVSSSGIPSAHRSQPRAVNGSR